MLEAIGARSAGSSARSGRSGPTTSGCAACAPGTQVSGAPEFEALSERITLAPGEGLPGRVLACGEPVWIVDAPEDGNFPRADVARRDGLHAAFGFPLLSPRGVVGVMEFFSRELREPDERLLETMRELGSQVGQFVARRQRRGGGARERVAAAGDARGRARRGRDDGSQGTRGRLEPCGRDDLRLSRATRRSGATWPS